MNIRNGFTFQLSVCALFCLMAGTVVLGEDQFTPPRTSPFDQSRTSQVGNQAYTPPQPNAIRQQNKQLFNNGQPSRTTNSGISPAALQRQRQQQLQQGSVSRTTNNVGTNQVRSNSVPTKAAHTTNANSQTNQSHTSLKKIRSTPSVSEPPRTIGGDSSSELEGNPAKKKSSTPALVSPGKLLTAFTFVIFLIIVSARYWKKHLPGNGIPISNELLTVLGERKLNKNHSISLVRLGSRILVLGASADGLRTLTEITDPIEIDLLSGMARSNQADTAFTSALGSLMKKPKPKTSAAPATASLGAKTSQQTTAASLLSSLEDMKRG